MHDAHIHLGEAFYSRLLEDDDLRARLRNMKLATASFSPQDWPTLRRFHAQLGAFPFYGLHPWWVAEQIDIAPALDQLSAWHEKHPGGVGEIGLDRLRPNMKNQVDAFEAQLKLAAKLKRPVCLHATRTVDEVVHRFEKHGPEKGMLHAFIGNAIQAQRAVDAGLYLSVGERSLASPKTVSALQQISIERILLETDGPTKTGLMPWDTELLAIRLETILGPYDFDQNFTAFFTI